MASGVNSNSASKPARGSKQAPQQSSIPRKNSSASEKDEDLVLQSIASKTSFLLNPQVTLTCYIPSQSVGAVIGRRGSTIAQIQRQAQQYGTVRVSIVGHDDETDNIPYTFSELDWSSPDWTPVVIRGDPCASLYAAERLKEYTGGELDDVILDIPLSRNKQACVLGKRGFVLQNLSADTQVRIMVPRRGLRQDVVQLEGELDRVKTCLEKVLSLLHAATQKKKEVSTIQVPILPSQTKCKNVTRKTETTIQKKKQEDDTWLLIVSGSQPDNVQVAVGMLEKWKEELTNNKQSVLSPQRKRQQRGGKTKKGGKGSTPLSAPPEQPTSN